MPLEQPTERDYALMDRVLQEARAALAAGGAGVAALLASPNKIIAVALNTIQDTGDMTNHAEMVLLHQMDYPAHERRRAQDSECLCYFGTLSNVQCRAFICGNQTCRLCSTG